MVFGKTINLPPLILLISPYLVLKFRKDEDEEEDEDEPLFVPEGNLSWTAFQKEYIWKTMEPSNVFQILVIDEK